MLASPRRATRVARNFGFWARNILLRLPNTRVNSFGLNFNLRQALAWKPAPTGAELNFAGSSGSPPPPKIEPEVSSLRQLVGLTMKPFLLALTSIERILSLAPPKTCGIALVVGRIRAVSGSTNSATLTATVPRSNGPAVAGVITARDRGAPS